MKFTATKIGTLLKEDDADCKVNDICRESGRSSARLYHWLSNYGVKAAFDIEKLTWHQEENEKLKLMRADMALENQAFMHLLGKL